MYRGGQLRDISEVSEVGVTIIQQFRHLGPFIHPCVLVPQLTMADVTIGGFHMTSSKHNYANYDRFLPNFSMVRNTI